MRYAKCNGNMSFDVDVSKMKTFLGVLLISGYCPVPRRRMYWEKSIDSSNMAISNAMSRNDFDNIMRYFHLADNNNLGKSDKFSKVRPLLKHIDSKCQEFFIPEQEISIDESMVPYYGRHGGKQYMHGKPIKFGCSNTVEICGGFRVLFPVRSKVMLNMAWENQLFITCSKSFLNIPYGITI